MWQESILVHCQWCSKKKSKNQCTVNCHHLTFGKSKMEVNKKNPTQRGPLYIILYVYIDFFFVVNDSDVRDRCSDSFMNLM